MVKLEPDPFLNELNKLFERNAAKGSVSITMKHSNLVSKRHKKHAEVTHFVCLVRATDGKRKFSTEVSAKDHVRFQMAYATILKAHMGSLKRREKVKSSRKEKAAA
mmetsp:Transcript_20357/g.61345  ORF Transcript_20357/g.61345 Transcript_20357/m.61345 type:complete len:106 (-) Transcript_20357:2103-2420(-)